MVTIFAVHNQILPRLAFWQQPKAAAKIPASRTLAKISAERRHIANLRAGSVVDRLSQRGILFYHIHIVGKFSERGEGANAESLAAQL